jgi:hypothetical protein
MAKRVAQAVNYQNFFVCLAKGGWLSWWQQRSTTRTFLVVYSQAWMAEQVVQAVNYQNFFGC